MFYKYTIAAFVWYLKFKRIHKCDNKSERLKEESSIFLEKRKVVDNDKTMVIGTITTKKAINYYKVKRTAGQGKQRLALAYCFPLN